MTGRTDVKTRCAVPSDETALRHLYQTVFGDDDASTDLFFKTWFDTGLTIIADMDDKPAAAAYILPVGPLVLQDQTAYPCAMLYAIGTSPDCRGRGLGEAVTRAAAEHAFGQGYPVVVLKPAEDSLFDFYADRCGFQPFFEASVREYTAAELAGRTTAWELNAVPPGEYRRLRQTFLSGGAYIDMTERSLTYQAQLSEASGGGLYALTSGGKDYGCAVIEHADGAADIKELLVPDDVTDIQAAAAIAAKFPAARYRVRSVGGTAPASHFGMIYGLSELSSKLSVQTVKWYGPAFD